MLRATRNNRTIADYDIGLTDDWHQVDLDPETSASWPGSLAARLASEEAATRGLAARLAAVQETMRGMEAPQLTAAVWVPKPDSGDIASILAFGLVELVAGQDPALYRVALAADEGRSEDGVDFLDVRTWEARIDAGICVGAYNKIAHARPGTPTVVEERTVFGVFPPRSKQMIECIFIAQSSSSYDDIVEQTQAVVGTVTVVLEKG
jgi:hypothetical protein